MDVLREGLEPGEHLDELDVAEDPVEIPLSNMPAEISAEIIATTTEPLIVSVAKKIIANSNETEEAIHLGDIYEIPVELFEMIEIPNLSQ